MTGNRRLHARDLHFAYGDLKVLDGVDLSPEPGRVTCLVGPNGSGKSTLLALLAGVLEPQAGRVTWNDQPLGAIPPGERAACLGWLPQSATEAFGFTVLETVTLGLEAGRSGLALPGPDELALAHNALQRMGLTELGDRTLHTLSGGERQRALLAAVLVASPRALLLDEPTAALDPHQAVRVMEELAAPAREGRTVVIVTHDLNLASLYADRIHLLAERRILATGSPGEVLVPANLERAYGPGTVLVDHPAGGRPMVLPARPAAAPAAARTPRAEEGGAP